MGTPSQITGDIRHVNEDTSSYLGQQIVKAIFAHVNDNPKFKEQISPGLSGKTSTQYKEVKENKRALDKNEYPLHVQSLLQKVIVSMQI